MKIKLMKQTAILLACSMVLLLTACGGSGSGGTTQENTQDSADTADTAGNDGAGSGGEVTLNVWHQWANDVNELKKLYDEAAAVYMEENPNVKIVTQTLFAPGADVDIFIEEHMDAINP